MLNSWSLVVLVASAMLVLADDPVTTRLLFVLQSAGSIMPEYAENRDDHGRSIPQKGIRVPRPVRRIDRLWRGA